MMDSEYPSSDIEDANTPETPLSGTQKTCLRTVPCMQSECSAPTCSIPKNHVRDLTDAMDDVLEVTTVTKPTASPAGIVRTSSKPRPPADHIIVSLNEMFLEAIEENDILYLESAMNLYTLASSSNLDLTSPLSGPPAITPSKFSTPDSPPLLRRYLHPPPSLTLCQSLHPPPVSNRPS